MRALREQRHGMQQLGDLAFGVVMAEHRQPERRLGNEHIAWHQFERWAGRIGDVLVIAGGDDGHAAAGDADLRRAEHVPGRVEAHLRAAERERLAVADDLRRAGETLAVAQAHDVERLLRRQHGAVPGARVVGMAVGDQGLLDRAGRIDVEAAGLAAHAGRGRDEDVFGTHRL